MSAPKLLAQLKAVLVELKDAEGKLLSGDPHCPWIRIEGGLRRLIDESEVMIREAEGP